MPVDKQKRYANETELNFFWVIHQLNGSFIEKLSNKKRINVQK